MGCLAVNAGTYAAQTADYDLNSYTAKDAYDAGRIMRAQFKEESARAYLKYAADKGDADAAYLYAIDITHYSAGGNTPHEARTYFVQAAKQGQLEAMKYLYMNGSWLREGSRLNWQKHYHDGLVELAAKNPGKASYELAKYYYSTDEDRYEYYLNKSIAYDYPYAILANVVGINEIESHNGNPVIDSSDMKPVIKIAESGFMPAIRSCINFYEEDEDFREALHWRLKALEQGDLTSLAVAAKIYAGKIPGYSFVKKDYPKAYAYVEVYLDNAGKSKFSNVYKMMENLYADLVSNMTTAQLKDAAKLTESYKKNVTFYSFDSYWDK